MSDTDQSTMSKSVVKRLQAQGAEPVATQAMQLPRRIWIEESWINNIIQVHYNPTRTRPALGFAEYVRADTRASQPAGEPSDLISRRWAAGEMCGVCNNGVYPAEWVEEAGAYKHHTPSSETPWVPCRASRIHALPDAQPTPTTEARERAEGLEICLRDLNKPEIAEDPQRRATTVNEGLRLLSDLGAL